MDKKYQGFEGKEEDFYGESYYKGDNPDSPYSESSFTLEDIFAKTYVKLLRKTYGDDLFNKERFKFLDVGCCRGAYVKEFLENLNINLAIGIDFSEFAFKTKVIPDENFILMDMLKDERKSFGFKASTFDFILANDILEHFYEEDIHKILIKISSALKKSGFAHVNIGTGHCRDHFTFGKTNEWWENIFEQNNLINCPELVQKFFNEKVNYPLFDKVDWSQLFILRKI